MKRIIAIIALIVIAISGTSINTSADDDSLSSYNAELREIYNTDKLEIPSTTTVTIGGKSQVLKLNYNYLTRQQKGLDSMNYFKTALDGNYVVYGSEFGDTRKRPAALDYDITKRNKNELRYLGYSLDGSKFDNPAFPWSNMPDKGIIDWNIVKEPWKKSTIRDKYNLNKNGSKYNNIFINNASTYNIEKNIEYGLFAKYVILKADETVVNGKKDYLLYYGDTYENLIDNKRFEVVSLGGITNRAEVLKPDAVKASQNGWLDYVYILSVPTETTWGTGWLFYDNGAGVDYITVLLAPDELIEAVKSDDATKTEKTEMPADLNGDIKLSEGYITKAFNLSDIGGIQTFNFNYGSAGKHTHASTGKDGRITYKDYNRTIPLDQLYKYVVENETAINSKAVGSAGQFIPRYNGTNVKIGTAVWNGGSSSLKPNLFYVVFRGQDLPTIASYKEGNKHPLMELDLKAGKTPQSTRNSVGGYKDTFSFQLGKTNSNEADYSTLFTDGDSPKTQIHDTGNVANYNASLTVKSYIGKKNTAAEGSNYVTKSFSIGNIKFDHSKGYSIPNTNLIKFFPYVQMNYELPAANADGSGVVANKVDVLAAHESSIKPVDYVDVGWFNSKPSTSLTLESTQWSSHARAVNAVGKNNALPGGAIYTLDTKANQTKVGISTWQTYIPNDQLPNITAGSDYTLDNAISKDTKFTDEVKKTFDSLDVVQYIDNDKNLANAFGGIALLAKGGQRVGNNITSDNPKYWLKRSTTVSSANADEADLDIIDVTKVKTYYKVNSDVNGNVIVAKSTNGTTWTTLQKLTKTQTAANLTNAEAKALDDRTKLITNYIASIDRNVGNDPTAGGSWYNEAWDGVCMVKVDTIMTVGFNHPTKRSAAIDPHLCPTIDSKGDIFTKYYISQFKLSDKSAIRSSKPAGYIGTLNSTDIAIPYMDMMYSSRPFYIPNATVMDLY